MAKKRQGKESKKTRRALSRHQSSKRHLSWTSHQVPLSNKKRARSVVLFFFTTQPILCEFEIQYIHGPRNRADALSRISPGPTLCCVTLMSPIQLHPITQNILSIAKEDSHYQALYERALTGATDYVLHEQLLYYQAKDSDLLVLVIPNNGELIKQIILEAHTTNYAGHRGQAATIAFLKKHFVWPSLESDVKDYIKHCECQKFKRDYARAHLTNVSIANSETTLGDS